MKNFNQNIINENFNLSECITKIGKVDTKTLIVINRYNKIIGTVSDGDIRRGILKFQKLDTSVTKIMKKKFFCFTHKNIKKFNYDKLKKNNIQLIPEIDKNKKLVAIRKLSKNLNRKFISCPVLIMAGGFGTRLRPLTNKLPKPMIKINGEIILEKIINNFKVNGFKDFYISTFYKSGKIIKYFKDGTKFDVKIKYLREKKPLGTAGSLSLIPKNVGGPILIANGDVLTRMDPNLLLEFHTNQKNDLTVATINYNHQLPFGSIKIKNNHISELIEKPVTTHKINAGIYVINRNIYSKLKYNKNLSMTDLISKLILKKNKIGVFPIYESWDDIGDRNKLIKLNKENIISL